MITGEVIDQISWLRNCSKVSSLLIKDAGPQFGTSFAHLLPPLPGLPGTNLTGTTFLWYGSSVLFNICLTDLGKWETGTPKLHKISG